MEIKRNKFTVISYCTTEYESEIKNLVESLEKFNIPYAIELVASLGTWELNTKYKATFVKKMLTMYNPALFVDADAIFKNYPTLCDNLDCDIAVHYREGIELLSGTIWAQNTEATNKLLDIWIERNRTEPERIEQRILQKIIEDKLIPDLKVYELPATYTQIFDIMADTGEPVILHMQASRRLRKVVG